MTRKAFFAYEVAFHGGYIPVIYYDEDPRYKKESTAKDATPSVISVIELDQTIIKDDEVSLSFAELERLYPNPLKNATSNARKERNMARPVSGYQTAQGQFFEEEYEANLYEASYELHNVIKDIMRANEKIPADQLTQEGIINYIRDKIFDNRKIITEYINAKTEALKNTDTTEAVAPPKQRENLDNENTG